MRKWKKVTKPTVWKPNAVGDSIEGIYIGELQIEGRYGRYSSYQIRTANGEVQLVSGVVLAGLFNKVTKGTTVKLVFIAEVTKPNRAQPMRDFELHYLDDSGEQPNE